MGVTRRALGAEVKSLQYFLNRTAVLNQYREFLRTTKPLADDVRQDVRRQVRAGFDAYRNEEDERRVGLLLRQARDQLKMVSDLVDTAVAQQRSAESKRDWKKGDWAASKQQAPAAAAPVEAKDTWMDSPSDGEDGKDDVKGRVGTGWPWKSDKGTDKLDLEGIKRR
ncbi:hypothetical protein PHYSODRAFT_547502 [Phytophthora sojae]|uniref:Complex 1 LYR protein domain-containing protein n=1 Tax=Phytophthora sojae (strain P6497) TaxID=1094619 RepID=G4ZS11_PHYSP|nr:hypothetical protein PHYSODRAFT_547502 [Phytophthora sojae]EGZ14190.1 hypothetical protein PHYSODRAFT_547502 [Phytophthora sojae]|eukprot:XP_009531619.1 hypothetical protein PHYSODRAFT_547502 [Phytophthora sojae]